MQVLEAAELLVEILTKCKKLDGASFTLTPHRPEITLAEGYKVHIGKDAGIDQETFNCVTDIATIRGLSHFQDASGLMIYRSIKPG
jgi:hypothetical protein